MAFRARPQNRSWFSIAVTVPSEAREAIEYGLMEAGAIGTETSDVALNVVVLGYYETRPELETVRAALGDALRIYNLAPASLIDLNVREIADRDWLAEWKKDWQPVEVGRFIVCDSVRASGQSHHDLYRTGHGVWHGHARNHAAVSENH